MKAVAVFLFLCCVLQVPGQKTLSADELMSVILEYHPVVKQARINIKIARAEILASKGDFDPRFTTENARKEFDGLTYYDQRSYELRVPTWYGIDLFAGGENISGARVNTEETLGSATYIGFSIQPLQNLLMDKRRATLLQAKNLHRLSEIQMRMIVNDLLREALYDYWNWWERYHVHDLIGAALANAENRFALVRSAFHLGERPAIDTLESYTQVQSFKIKLSEAYQKLVEANLQLSTFMWTNEGAQTGLPFDVIPQADKQIDPIVLEEVINVVDGHPRLIQYDYKLRGLQIEKKLAFQSLLPEVKLKYNQTGYNLSKTINSPWFNNNYRFGISITTPLRLSEGRGRYQISKLRLESTGLEQERKKVELHALVKQYYSDWQQTQTQLELQNRLLANTRLLQRAEETRFHNGESSLFLINTRELKTIEAEQKLVEMKAKVQKTAVGVRWSAGLLAQ